MNLWMIIYALGGIGSAIYIWVDAEFRPVDRILFTVFGLLAWPIALPWYLLARPESLVKDMQYGSSYQHYKDFVKTKGRDLGDGVDEDIARRDEEAKQEKERKEKIREERGSSAFDDADDDIPRVQTIVIGERSAPVEPVGAWGNLPDADLPATAPRQGYSGDTHIGESVRDRLYGGQGHAFEMDEVQSPPAAGSSQSPASQPSAPQPSASESGGWNLQTPPASAPTPAPAPVARDTSSFRSRLYSEEELVMPGAESARETFQDHNLERLIEEGQLREAHRISKRMLEMATRLGESDKQAAYQHYFQDLERRIATGEVPLDD